jgi:tetratricopeptide (TPR) repeat protein
MLSLVPLVAVALDAALRPTISSRQPAPVLVLVLATLLVEIGATRRQCAIWSDPVTIWTHAYDHGAANDFAVLNNLGYALTLEGRGEEANPHLKKALAASPGDPNVHHSLGAAFMALDRNDEAAAEFREALRLAPGHPEARRDLMLLLGRQKPEPVDSPGR